MDTLKGTGITLTDSDYQKIESIYGKIPVEMKQFYLQNNGGTTKKKVFIDSSGFENEVEYFLSFINGNKSYKKSIEEFYSVFTNDWEAPKSLLPFARNSGGDFYCIDNITGKVALFFSDPDEGDPRIVSNDFSAFIKHLNLI